MLKCHPLGNSLANKPLTNNQEAGSHTRNPASDLLFWVGVAGFEPTASSSRTASTVGVVVTITQGAAATPALVAERLHESVRGKGNNHAVGTTLNVAETSPAPHVTEI